MEILAKFKVTEITQYSYGGDSRQVVLRAEYDPNLSEDQKFAKATPTAKLEMTVDNPEALKELTLGRVFYLSFVPVE